MRFLTKINTTVFLVLLLPAIVNADVVKENATLARINSLLNAVYPLIQQAQKQAPQNTRVSFNYSALKGDVQAIQDGIAQKINASQFVPQKVKPLQTQYLVKQSSHK